MGFVKTEELKELNLADGITARAITGDSITVAHVRLEEGAVLAEHSHPHEQIVNVIMGELELNIGGHVHRLSPGCSYCLKANEPHSGKAIRDTFVIDVFHPVREDFV